jgi:transposase InsO family protein
MPGREIATRRYEREQPGEMIHVDIKKLAAVSAGSFLSHLHRRRLARGLQQIMKTERSRCAVAFLKAAVAYNESLGITVLRAMTDNGSCYRSKAFARACRRLWLKHVRTKPYPREPTARPRASSRHRYENGQSMMGPAGISCPRHASCNTHPRFARMR